AASRASFRAPTSGAEAGATVRGAGFFGVVLTVLLRYRGVLGRLAVARGGSPPLRPRRAIRGGRASGSRSLRQLRARLGIRKAPSRGRSQARRPDRPTRSSPPAVSGSTQAGSEEASARRLMWPHAQDVPGHEALGHPRPGGLQ